MKKVIILELITFLIMVVFLYTSASKWVDFEGFRGDMINQPFPNWLGRVVAWVLPSAEAVIVILLVVPKTKMVGLISTLIFFLMFTIYAILILSNSFNRIPCSCGGVIGKFTWEQHLFFNLFFVAISIIAIMLRRRIQADENEIKSNMAYAP